MVIYENVVLYTYHCTQQSINLRPSSGSSNLDHIRGKNERTSNWTNYDLIAACYQTKSIIKSDYQVGFSFILDLGCHVRKNLDFHPQY